MTTLVIATRNLHKLREIRGILGEGFDYRTLQDFPGAPAVTEDAGTFAGNAAKKAITLSTWLAGNPDFSYRVAQSAVCVLADDSGLEVDALGGAPGVHSARFAALGGAGQGNAGDSANNAKLLRLLADVPADQRRARFRCVIALAPVLPPPDRVVGEAETQTELFEGVCEGGIGFEPRGQNGFGYDPLFTPLGHTQSFAELSEAVKNRLSHRAQALMKLKARLARW
jgi:XTP/dITP diphosphohydrolase